MNHRDRVPERTPTNCLLRAGAAIEWNWWQWSKLVQRRIIDALILNNTWKFLFKRPNLIATNGLAVCVHYRCGPPQNFGKFDVTMNGWVSVLFFVFWAADMLFLRHA